MIKQRFLIDTKHAKARTTIVYFHGIFSTAHSCRALEEVASELGINFLAYTMPMHGNNHMECPDDLSLDNIRKMIKEIISNVKTPNIILASHSAGANWVVESIRIFGQAKFKKIILVSPINASIKILNKNKLQTIHQLWNEKKRLSEIFADLTDANIFFYDFHAVERYHYYDYLKTITSRNLLLANNEVFATVKIPTIILMGKSDIVIDSQRSFDLFTETNPKFKITVLDAAHSPHIDQKVVFKEIVTDFLKS